MNRKLDVVTMTGEEYDALRDEIDELRKRLSQKMDDCVKAAYELERLANEGSDAWKEAAIGWTVCASVHEVWAKGKDALYTTRHAYFERQVDDARQRHALLTPNAGVTGLAPEKGNK